jgi:probable rRNA maturation factor
MADRPPSRQTRRRVGPDDGSLSVFVADERNDESDAPPLDGRRWATLAEQVLEAEGVRGDTELSVLFVDESAMAALNERFMGSTGPTDVLAFPIDGELVEPGRWPDGGTEGPERTLADQAEMPLLLGDVVICPAVAARQAPEHAGDLEGELALLLVHGVLHLLGHDHADDEQRAVMQARERDLLARFQPPLKLDPWAS